jgi:predicted dehydrogenase
MGATHAVTYSKLPGMRIAAVSARNAQRLSGDFSDVGGNLDLALPNVDFSRTGKYRDWEELIADPAIDAVDICLPTDLHERVAVAALSSGKHVLCEKPMALTAEDCDLMLAKAEEADRILMIGHVLRFWPAYEYLQQFVALSGFGPVQAATFTRMCGLPDWSSWLTDTSRSGGAVLDLLVHDLDQILLLFGAPEAIRAKALGNFDAVTATFLYSNGPEIRLQGGWMASGTPFSMAFQVRTARALLELGPNGLTLSDAEGKQHRVQTPDANPYTEQLTYFQQCCQLGRKPDRCPPEAAAAAVKAALLLKRSRDLDGEQVQCAL